MTAQLPKYGLFSPYTLHLQTDATGEHPAGFLKRAALMFEHLVFVPEGLADFCDRDSAGGWHWWLDLLYDGPKELTQSFRSIFKHSEEFWDDTNKLNRDLWENVEHDLWRGERSARFLSWVDDEVDRELDKGALPNNPGDVVERKKHYISKLSYDFKLLTTASVTFPEIAGLFTALHERAALAALSVQVANTDTIISSLPKLIIQDMGQLSWPSIFALRKSGFLSEFRNKLGEWADDYASLPDTQLFQDRLQKTVNEALWSLIDETRPDLGLTVLSAVAGAIPTLGVLNNVKTIFDISSELRRNRTYGWLYFISEARSNATLAR